MREIVTVTVLRGEGIQIKVSDDAGNGTRYLTIHTASSRVDLARAVNARNALDQPGPAGDRALLELVLRGGPSEPEPESAP